MIAEDGQQEISIRNFAYPVRRKDSRLGSRKYMTNRARRRLRSTTQLIFRLGVGANIVFAANATANRTLRIGDPDN